jgi:cyclohexyl-isocyanide hydratase
MDDEETLDFLRRQAESASYVTSVCTGSLILAAAGLLTGYCATCHWGSIDQLALFGSTPVSQRVVIDRNRVTGAGVSAGLDFALLLTAELFGIGRAERVQLSMEYDPRPPVSAGSPSSASTEVVEDIRGFMASLTASREKAAKKAAAKLRARD